MLSQEQQQGEVKSKVQEWIGRFVQLKLALFGAKADIERVLRANLSPQDRQEIGHLQKRQGEIEQRFFEIEGRLLAMAQSLGYPLPGLGLLGLGDNPVSLLASATKLWWDATAHIQRVAEYKARIGPGQATPLSLGQGTAWGIGTYLLIGIIGWIVLKKVL